MTKAERAHEVASEIRKYREWYIDMLKELCYLADMDDEWNNADGETFEQVAFAAAKKLGVELI